MPMPSVEESTAQETMQLHDVNAMSFFVSLPAPFLISLAPESGNAWRNGFDCARGSAFHADPVRSLQENYLSVSDVSVMLNTLASS
jgi:hypothetical protein